MCIFPQLKNKNCDLDGSAAWWQSVSLVCLKSWGQSPAPRQKQKGIGHEFAIWPSLLNVVAYKFICENNTTVELTPNCIELPETEMQKENNLFPHTVHDCAKLQSDCTEESAKRAMAESRLPPHENKSLKGPSRVAIQRMKK